MKTKQQVKKFIVSFKTKSTQPRGKITPRSFFELASQTISQSKKGANTTASKDVDKIVYGVTR